MTADWWRGETTFLSGLMTRVSTLFSGLDRNDKYAEHKADAFCKYSVFPKGLNWPAHACKAPLEYERDFEKKKRKRKEENRREILNVHVFRFLASWFKSDDDGMENIYSRVSSKKHSWQWTLTFSCIQLRIYSTINISRLREDRRRIFIDTKTIYIRVKYTMQHERKKGNGNTDPARWFYIWQVSQ